MYIDLTTLSKALGLGRAYHTLRLESHFPSPRRQKNALENADM